MIRRNHRNTTGLSHSLPTRVLAAPHTLLEDRATCGSEERPAAEVPRTLPPQHDEVSVCSRAPSLPTQIPSDPSNVLQNKLIATLQRLVAIVAALLLPFSILTLNNLRSDFCAAFPPRARHRQASADRVWCVYTVSDSQPTLNRHLVECLRSGFFEFESNAGVSGTQKVVRKFCAEV